jgi:hypothetical protein
MNTELTDRQIDLLIGMIMLKAMEEQANQPLPTEDEIANYMTFSEGIDSQPTESVLQLVERVRSSLAPEPPRQTEG